MKYLPFLCVALIGLNACQVVDQLPGLGSDAHQREGQMSYQTGRRSVVGDFILRSRNNGEYDLAFSKGGVSVLQVQVHNQRLVATGLFASKGWSGPLTSAPGPLRSFALFSQVVPHFETNEASASNNRVWTATIERKNGKLSGANVKYRRGDSMVFSFAQ